MTFDDGPDPVWTPRLLDLLRRLDARATFFPIAPRAAAYPRLVARMLDEGHAVGLHCREHVRHSERDVEWVRNDTRLALARLAGLGVRPTLWRTPWGDTARWSRRVAREHGLRLIGWTADTNDWQGHAADEMLDRTRELLVDGAIVLAHDGNGPGAMRTGAAETLAYVELLAAHARRRGLGLEALEPLVATLAAIERRLSRGGRLVCVHGRTPGPERPVSGDRAHAVVRQLPWLRPVMNRSCAEYLLETLERM